MNMEISTRDEALNPERIILVHVQYIISGIH